MVVVVVVRMLSRCSTPFPTDLERWGGGDVSYVQVQRMRMAWARTSQTTMRDYNHEKIKVNFVASSYNLAIILLVTT